ncbi:MAG: hypothetical protein H8D32_00160 [Dehalococcoidia bacterium]|nr:hypothetical protein [Dehalococcoidia bacterium]
MPLSIRSDRVCISTKVFCQNLVTSSGFPMAEYVLGVAAAPGEASSLKERMSSILDKEPIHIARLGPGLGVHGGPGTLIVALREEEG